MMYKTLCFWTLSILLYINQCHVTEWLQGRTGNEAEKFEVVGSQLALAETEMSTGSDLNLVSENSRTV